MLSGLLASAHESADSRTATARISPCRFESGVTLIEVLIAALVVSLAAIGTALMLSSGLAFIDAHADDRVALYLAQHKLEQMRSRGFASLRVGSGITDGCIPVGSFPSVGIQPERDDPACPGNLCRCYVETPPNQPPYVYSTTFDSVTGTFTYHITNPPGGRVFPDYARTTVVECVDIANFENVITCPTPELAKRITVTVQGPSVKGRPLVMQTVLTRH